MKGKTKKWRDSDNRTHIQWTDDDGMVHEIITTHYANGGFISKQIQRGEQKKLQCVAGKRKSGRSTFITNAIGTGEDTLVVVETDHDFDHHKKRSPNATVMYIDQLAGLVEMPIKSRIALDNVIFDPDDSLLDTLMKNTFVHTIILCVSHPDSIPKWYEGHTTLLSQYASSHL